MVVAGRTFGSDAPQETRRKEESKKKVCGSQESVLMRHHFLCVFGSSHFHGNVPEVYRFLHQVKYLTIASNLSHDFPLSLPGILLSAHVP